MRPLNVLFAPNKLRRWLLVLFVGLISLASYWVLEIIRNQNGEGTKKLRIRPDYFVEHFNFVKMNPDGQNKYRIVGTKLVHYPDDDHADITLPVITSLDPAQPPITTRAERAAFKNIANTTESEIHLYEKVVINRPATDKAEHLQLNTDYLVSYPDKHTAETNFPVEIISGDTVTTGVGMKASDITQQVQILKNVYSVILPGQGRSKRLTK